MLYISSMLVLIEDSGRSLHMCVVGQGDDHDPSVTKSLVIWLAMWFSWRMSAPYFEEARQQINMLCIDKDMMGNAAWLKWLTVLVESSIRTAETLDELPLDMPLLLVLWVSWEGHQEALLALSAAKFEGCFHLTTVTGGFKPLPGHQPFLSELWPLISSVVVVIWKTIWYIYW